MSRRLMGPRCFLHVPKSAGTSIRTSLERALPPGAVGPKRQDASHLCGFAALDRLEPAIRALLTADDDEIAGLADHAIVSGHFSLPTLLRIAPASSIATVLREPRARLLSHFAFWRLSSETRQVWRGYPALEHALRPLDEFLDEPQIAQATDNVVCRMVLFGDARIPEREFITEPEAIAADTIEALETLGFVGVVELQDSMWDGLSDFFGVRLSPTFLNATASQSTGSDTPVLDLDVSARTLELIASRTTADAIVYGHFLSRRRSPSPAAKQLRAAAFASELVRLGNVASSSAIESQAHARELGQRLETEARRSRRLEHELQQTRDELARNRVWLDGLQASASWRVTAPARAAKRAVKRLSLLH